MRTFNHRLWPELCLAVLMSAGCGGPTLYPTRGKVTYRNQPARGALVTLIPVTRNYSLPAYPRGEVGADGTFVLTTLASQDGAPAGEYKLTVRWPEESTGKPKTLEELEEQSGGGDPPDRLKGRFTDPAKSPWTVTITAGDNTLEPIDIPVSDDGG